MIELSYNYAIVSFCSDLTSGKSHRLPVGVLLVGKTDQEELAASYVPSIQNKLLSDITNEVLRSIPKLLKEQMNTHLRSALSPAETLQGLHEKLRNSIYVSTVSKECTLHCEPSQMQSKILNEILPEVYTKALAKDGWNIASTELRIDSLPQANQRLESSYPSISLGIIPDNIGLWSGSSQSRTNTFSEMTSS